MKTQPRQQKKIFATMPLTDYYQNTQRAQEIK